MDDFVETMNWCTKHEVAIKLQKVDDEHFMVTAEFGPLSSEALFTTKDTFLDAFYFVTSSILAGFNFHMQHGFVPKVPQ